MVDFVSLVK